MKKIFLFSLFIFIFLFLSKTSVFAVTCSSLGATCVRSSAFCSANDGTTVSGTTGCSYPNSACCQFNACETASSCASKGYQCGSFTSNCNKSIACPNTCTSTQTCSKNKCVATAYTCEKTTGQYCSPETCASAGDLSGSGTCPIGRRCCKINPSPPCSSVLYGGICVDPLQSAGCAQTASNTSCNTSGKICCKTTNQPPPPGGNDCEANAGGKCMPICSSPISGTTGCTSPNVCCSFASGGENCIVCPTNYYYYPSVGKCVHYEHDDWQVGATRETCTTGQKCTSTGCKNVSSSFSTGRLPCGSDGKGTDGTGCPTALGSIKIDPASLVKDFFGIVLSISGGIAVLLIILSGYRLIASQGNPEKIKEAQEHLTAAVIGLLFVIFSFSILKFIGVDVLKIFP